MSLTIEKCLQAWTNSLRQMKAKADIVFFGDSLTYYGDFSLAFPNKAVCNLGLRGDTIQGLIDRVEQVRMLEPTLVFLMGGINDVARVSADEFEKLYDQWLDSIIQVLPEATIIVQNILPVNTKEFSISCNNNQINDFNNRIQKVSEERNLVFMDVHSMYEENGQLPGSMTKDGIHLSPEAYDSWYVLLRRIVCDREEL